MGDAELELSALDILSCHFLPYSVPVVLKLPTAEAKSTTTELFIACSAAALLLLLFWL